MPTAYFVDYPDNVIVTLRDSTVLTGTIADPSESVFSFKSEKGVRYKFNWRSVLSVRSELVVPTRRTHLKWYKWNDKGVRRAVYDVDGEVSDRKASSEFQPGYFNLRDGSTIEGMVSVEGRYEYGSFALYTGYYLDKAGEEIAIPFTKIKSYGLNIPANTTKWSLYDYKFQLTMARKAKTKPSPGWVKLNSGKRLKGDLGLEFEIIRGPKPKTENESRKVAESWYLVEVTLEQIDGEVVVPLNDIMSYGLDMKMTDVTLPPSTNVKGSGLLVKRPDGNTDGIVSKYDEKLNFHPGYVKLKDGTKIEGKVAHFGTINYYRGALVETEPGAQLQAFTNSELDEIHQDIPVFDIAEFEDISDFSTGNSVKVNGYIIKSNFEKEKGNISFLELSEDQSWARSIDFKNTDGEVLSYGGTNPRINYLMIETDSTDTYFFQYGSIFVRATKVGNNLLAADNPFPETISGFGKFLVGAMSAAGGALTRGLESNGVEVTDDNPRDDGADLFVENMPSNNLTRVKDEKIFYLRSTDESTVYASKARSKGGIEILVEGCLEYHYKNGIEQRKLLSFKNWEDSFNYLDGKIK